MSEDFCSIPPDLMSDYLEGLLPKKVEKDILLKVNTIDDLWVLAQMKLQKKMQK
jgi:hypothetical protein